MSPGHLWHQNITAQKQSGVCIFNVVHINVSKYFVTNVNTNSLLPVLYNPPTTQNHSCCISV